MLACVWYTELTCIPDLGPKADIMGQVIGLRCVCVVCCVCVCVVCCVCV